VPVSGPQVGWAGAVGAGLVAGGVAGLDGGGVWWCPFCGGAAVAVALGFALGVVVGIMPELSMFHAWPENCGAGNCWTGSGANADSANVFQIRAGQ
jgi:hypothetical protein